VLVVPSSSLRRPFVVPSSSLRRPFVPFASRASSLVSRLSRLAQVVPSEYGTQLPPWFPLDPSFWSRLAASAAAAFSRDGGGGGGDDDDRGSTVEPPPATTAREPPRAPPPPPGDAGGRFNPFGVSLNGRDGSELNGTTALYSPLVTHASGAASDSSSASASASASASTSASASASGAERSKPSKLEVVDPELWAQLAERRCVVVRGLRKVSGCVTSSNRVRTQ